MSEKSHVDTGFSYADAAHRNMCFIDITGHNNIRSWMIYNYI